MALQDVITNVITAVFILGMLAYEIVYAQRAIHPPRRPPTHLHRVHGTNRWDACGGRWWT